MRLRDYFNIIPLLVFAAVASVQSMYPVYNPRTRQYGPFEGNWPFDGNYAPNPMGPYMPPYAPPYMSPYPSPYMNPNIAPYMNPNPAPYMNPNAAPYMNSYPGPGMNPYPDPYRNSYLTRNNNPADARPNNFPRPGEGGPPNLPHPGEGAPSQQHPAYEDLHALVQHRLPGFFGKHEHRLLWSPKLKPEENSQPSVNGQTEPPIPKAPEPEENAQSGAHGETEPPVTTAPGYENYRSYVPSNENLTIPHNHESNENSSQLTNPEGHGSNESNSQPVNPEGHSITKRQVNNSPESLSEIKDRLYTEFSKTLSLGDNYSSDDLIKLYVHTLLHPDEFKNPKMYAEYLAWLIALKYNVKVNPSTAIQKYPQFASVGKHETMKNPPKPDSPSLGPPAGNNLKPGNYTLYYKEGHKEQTRGTYNKLFFGSKGSIYDDHKSGSLGDQTI